MPLNFSEMFSEAGMSGVPRSTDEVPKELEGADMPPRVTLVHDRSPGRRATAAEHERRR
jgi:hypothetical protein